MTLSSELPATASEPRITGCRTTKIYCRPTCRYAPRVKPRNVLDFTSIAAARAAGYRACKVCKPDEQ